MDWRLNDPRREELVADVRRLAQEGMSSAEIAEAIHVPESTIRVLMKSDDNES